MSSKLTWQELKAKGNSLYGLCRYQDALKQYCQAIETLEKQSSKTDITNSMKAEVAKLYSNRSVTQLNLALKSSGKPDKKPLLEKALSDGMMSLQLDPAFQKGYYRVCNALCELNRKEDAVKYVNKLMDAHKSKGTKFEEDAMLLSAMKNCSYYSQTMKDSPNWTNVKYKDNCFVVDSKGAGDLVAINATIINFTDKASYLVRPGKYHITSTIVVTPGREIDIVGDIKDGEEVVFYTKGKVFDKETCHIFIAAGSTLSLKQVTVSQGTDHPEMHAVLGNMDANVQLRDVKCYSKCSGCVAAVNSKLTVTHCSFDEACGAVILASGAEATIKHCTIKDSNKIGIELRDHSSAVIEDCEILNCGSQAVVTHADAKGFTLSRCVLHNNARFMQSEASVQASSGRIKVVDTQLTGNRGGAIMISNEAHGDIMKCTIGGGNYGIGFSLKGSAYIKENTIRNVNMGVSIIFNLKGNVVLENNTMEKTVYDVILSQDDGPPKMIGKQHKCETKTDDIINLGNQLERKLLGNRGQRKKDKLRPGSKYEDPRKRISYNERHCSPCGMAQSTLETKFMMCSGCKVSWYCSKACQKKDWPLHKEECKKFQQLTGEEEKSKKS